MIAGGSTRWHSVYNGLQVIREESVIFVHDGVRCLLSEGLVHSCYEQAVSLGSAIPVIGSKDSVRVMTGEESVSVDRDRVKLVQTPQTFLREGLPLAEQTKVFRSFLYAILEELGIEQQGFHSFRRFRVTPFESSYVPSAHLFQTLKRVRLL